jgi:hypothetical protein
LLDHAIAGGGGRVPVSAVTEPAGGWKNSFAAIGYVDHLLEGKSGWLSQMLFFMHL